MGLEFSFNDSIVTRPIAGTALDLETDKVQHDHQHGGSASGVIAPPDWDIPDVEGMLDGLLHDMFAQIDGSDVMLLALSPVIDRRLLFRALSSKFRAVQQMLQGLHAPYASSPAQAVLSDFLKRINALHKPKGPMDGPCPASVAAIDLISKPKKTAKTLWAIERELFLRLDWAELLRGTGPMTSRWIQYHNQLTNWTISTILEAESERGRNAAHEQLLKLSSRLGELGSTNALMSVLLGVFSCSVRRLGLRGSASSAFQRAAELADPKGNFGQLRCRIRDKNWLPWLGLVAKDLSMMRESQELVQPRMPMSKIAELFIYFTSVQDSVAAEKGKEGLEDRWDSVSMDLYYGASSQSPKYHDEESQYWRSLQIKPL